MYELRAAQPVRVGMVLDQPFPPDARVEREALALVEAGYEVHLLCLLQDGQLERETLHQGIYIHRVRPEEVRFALPWPKGQTRLPYRGVFKNINRALWNIDTVWHTLIQRFVVRLQIDILHIHDLRLVSTGISVAKRYHLPLVADLHENYPALMQMFKGRENPARGERQRKKWDAIQQECTTQASAVITVSQEMKDILVAGGCPPEKITILPNTVDIEKFEAFPSDPEVMRGLKPYFLLTYVGHINSSHRGIQTVLQAMALLKDEIPDLFFVGAGGYREPYMEALQELVTQYGLQNRVAFTGWLDESEFVSYIKASDICLCPHISNDQTNTGIPNKVYLYHLFGKPIIASNFTPMVRYIEDSRGGLCFQSGNANDLAEKIRYLSQQKELRKQLGDQGRQAVFKTYNWQATAQSLVTLYDGLQLQAPGKPPNSWFRETSIR